MGDIVHSKYLFSRLRVYGDTIQTKLLQRIRPIPTVFFIVVVVSIVSIVSIVAIVCRASFATHKFADTER